MRLIHGLSAPSAGVVRWGERSAREARADQGYVFQRPPILRRSVWANVEFPLIAAGWPRAMRQARAAEALRRARLADKAALPAAGLSGGERQRMALARAWAPEPRILLLDEPCANLDPASVAEFESLLAEIRADGVKLFLATHDLKQAERLAEDVLFLDRGALAEQTSAARFFAAPTSEAGGALSGRRALGKPASRILQHPPQHPVFFDKRVFQRRADMDGDQDQDQPADHAVRFI